MRHWQILLFCCIGYGVNAQTTHTIRGLDFFYDPDTTYMVAGDSVKFQTQGIHDMVQTDSAAWAINQAISNGGFVTTIGLDTTFVIDTAGTYYFVCSPHGFVGMKGVLLVDSTISTGVHQAIATSRISVYPSPANDHFYVEGVEPGDEIELFDPLGNKVTREQAAHRGTTMVRTNGISCGNYFVVVRSNTGAFIGWSMLVVAE